MRFAIFAASAALSFAAPVQAATIVQTGSFSNGGSIAKFDPALGLLTNIITSFTYSVLDSATYYEPFVTSGATSTWTASYSGFRTTIIGSTLIASSNAFATRDLGVQGPGSITFNTALTTSPVETTFGPMAEFIGTGSAFLRDGGSAVFISFQQTSGPQYILQSRTTRPGASTRYSITYVYDAGATAVPEPATWAMLLAGFGLIGAGMRRRSAKPAHG